MSKTIDNQIESFLNTLKALDVQSFSISFKEQNGVFTTLEEPAKDPVQMERVKEPVQKEAVKEPMQKEAVKEPVQKEAKKVTKKTVKKVEKPKKAEVIDSNYDSFVESIENDDGTPEAREKYTKMIHSMKLDDLLRVNIDFGLCVDTDKPEDEVRDEIASCFQ